MKSASHCQLLLPAMFHELAAATACPPAMQALLRHAHRQPVFRGDDQAWRCRLFGVARQQDWPVAPFAALGEGLDTRSGYWLCATPVHLQLRRDSFTVTEGASGGLSMAHVGQLVEALNAHFASGGLRFFAPHPRRWYLRLAHPAALKTIPFSEAVGQDAQRLLPQGADALQWHARLNEMQMLLHNHPINLELEEANSPPVNSFWLWGGGVLPVCASPSPITLWATDAFSLGLARAHGGKARVLPDSAPDLSNDIASPGTHLVVLDQLAQSGRDGDAQGWRDALEQLERRWFSPLLQALRGGRLSSIALHLAGLRSVTSHVVTRTDLYKFWRRSQPLAAYLD